MTEASRLRSLQEGLAAGVGETLRSLVSMDVACAVGALELTDGPALRARLLQEHVVVSAALDHADAGRTLRVLFDARDAATLASAMMLAPAEQLAARRATGTLEAEDAQVFGEVANVLCSGIDNVLRARLGSAGARLQDHERLVPGSDAPSLGDGRLAVLGLALRIGSFDPTTAFVVLDQDVAEKWNGAPLAAHAATGAAAASAAPATEPTEEEIPQAPIRGKLAAYLQEPDSVATVRKSCRRVGFELDRRSKTEIPNPAAHKDAIVLLEIAAGEDRKFEWCKRLKAYHPSIRVLLVLHHASRQRVLQGFIAKADAILAYPMGERQLSAKLNSLLQAAAPVK